MLTKEKFLQALEAILEKDGLNKESNRGDEFICLAISHQFTPNLKSSEVSRMFDNYKPSKNERFKEFTESQYWLGKMSWWDWEARDWEKVKEIKYEYIRQVIDVLKEELNQ